MEKILIQEADEAIRDVLKLSLEADGFNVVLIAECTGQLMVIIRQFKPHLLVLDFRLEGQKSIQFCRKIKSAHPLLPVLAMSCNNNIGNAYTSFGFDGYIAKPFDLDDLHQTLRQHLC